MDHAKEVTPLEIVQQVVAQLPWGHNTLLDAVESAAEHEWYARQAIQHGWSRAVLVHQIESGLPARQGGTVTNFAPHIARSNPISLSRSSRVRTRSIFCLSGVRGENELLPLGRG
jgi:hypothetical protein